MKFVYLVCISIVIATIGVECVWSGRRPQGDDSRGEQRRPQPSRNPSETDEPRRTRNSNFTRGPRNLNFTRGPRNLNISRLVNILGGSRNFSRDGNVTHRHRDFNVTRPSMPRNERERDQKRERGSNSEQQASNMQRPLRNNSSRDDESKQQDQRPRMGSNRMMDRDQARNSDSSSEPSDQDLKKLSRAVRSIKQKYIVNNILQQFDQAINNATTTNKSGTPLWDFLPLWFQYALINQSDINSTAIVKDIVTKKANSTLIKWDKLSVPNQYLLLKQQRENTLIDVLLGNVNLSSLNLPSKSSANYSTLLHNTTCYTPTKGLLSVFSKYPFNLRLDENILKNLSSTIKDFLAPASTAATTTKTAPERRFILRGRKLYNNLEPASDIQYRLQQSNNFDKFLDAPANVTSALKSAKPNLLQLNFNGLVKFHLISCVFP